MIKFIVVVLLSWPQAYAAPGVGEWWANFCERHLVAEDPYQKHFRQAPVIEIVKEYRQQAALRYWTKRSHDEYEMMLWVLVSRLEQPISEEERSLIQEALEDYPSFR